ncbi:MAG: PPOX class F420-dependent oxidoreductase [Acidimicrobiia bacterium]
MPIDDLTGQFIVLTTYRRSGEGMPTTVWFARVGDVIIVPTGATTGKVKRLRNDPAVTMAKSNYRGKLKGEPVTGNARILEGDDVDRAQAALKKKYGIQWRLGGSNIDTFLEITPT